MASPRELIAQSNITDSLHPSTLDHFSVWDSVLLNDMEQGPEASIMKDIELYSMPAVDSRHLARIEQA